MSFSFLVINFITKRRYFGIENEWEKDIKCLIRKATDYYRDYFAKIIGGFK